MVTVIILSNWNKRAFSEEASRLELRRPELSVRGEELSKQSIFPAPWFSSVTVINVSCYRLWPCHAETNLSLCFQTLLIPLGSSHQFT